VKEEKFNESQQVSYFAKVLCIDLALSVVLSWMMGLEKV